MNYISIKIQLNIKNSIIINKKSYFNDLPLYGLNYSEWNVRRP